MHELDHLHGPLCPDLPPQRTRRDALPKMAHVREDTVARRTRRALALALALGLRT